MERKIKVVFFDAGNTLLYLDYAYIVSQLKIEGLETDLEKVKRAEYVSRRNLDLAMETGTVEVEDIWPMYFKGILRESGLSSEASVDRALKRIKEKNEYFGLWTYVPDEVRETLARIRRDGYMIGIISNSDGTLETLLKNTKMSDAVDFALDSFVVGYEKPDPRIFLKAMDMAGAVPDQCLHIGDIFAADVQGARGVGIYPLLLDPYGEKAADCDVISSISQVPEWLEKLNS